VIHFTRHALEKFIILRRHGFPVSRQSVLQTLQHPDTVNSSRKPLMIAQRNFDKSHVLRVVYKEERDVRVIITFYPGRKNQYDQP